MERTTQRNVIETTELCKVFHDSLKMKDRCRMEWWEDILEEVGWNGLQEGDWLAKFLGDLINPCVGQMKITFL